MFVPMCFLRMSAHIGSLASCFCRHFHLQILPLTRELTCLAGNLWARSLMGARAKRIEYLLVIVIAFLQFFISHNCFLIFLNSNFTLFVFCCWRYASFIDFIKLVSLFQTKNSNKNQTTMDQEEKKQNTVAVW